MTPTKRLYQNVENPWITENTWASHSIVMYCYYHDCHYCLSLFYTIPVCIHMPHPFPLIWLPRFCRKYSENTTLVVGKNLALFLTFTCWDPSQTASQTARTQHGSWLMSPWVTSPNHDRYMVYAMAPFLGDVQYTQNGTGKPTPVGWDQSGKTDPGPPNSATFVLLNHSNVRMLQIQGRCQKSWQFTSEWAANIQWLQRSN